MTDHSSKKPDRNSVLTINGGSSSIKFALYQAGEPLKKRLYGKIDRIGQSDTILMYNDLIGNRQEKHSIAAIDHRSAAKALMD